MSKKKQIASFRSVRVCISIEVFAIRYLFCTCIGLFRVSFSKLLLVSHAFRIAEYVYNKAFFVLLGLGNVMPTICIYCTKSTLTFKFQLFFRALWRFVLLKLLALWNVWNFIEVLKYRKLFIYRMCWMVCYDMKTLTDVE